MNEFRKISRFIAALLLLVMPFAALPLAFLRMTGKAVPLYGLVKMADFPVLSLLALGIILLFPENLKNFFRQKDLYRLFAAAGLFLLNSAISLFIRNSTFEELCTPLFWILYPLAAVAVADALKKILPVFAGIAAIILFYSGIVSENFTGLAGNWNWLQGFIIALLPAIALWGGKEKTLFPGSFLKSVPEERRNRAIILLALFFTAIGILFPETLSRGAITAAAGAGIFLYFRNRIEEKKFFRYFTVFIFLLAAGFIAGLLIFNLNDTRFLIWQGALDAAIDQLPIGHGCSRFSEVIREFLSEKYFLSPFPAPHIDHAHNDFLHLAVENGLPGIIFYFTALLIILRRRNQPFIQWIFITLIICGWFDQHNFTVTGAGLTAVAAGLLIVPSQTDEPEKIKGAFLLKTAGIISLAAAISFAIINYQTTTFIRQGDLALIRGDFKTAFSKYLDSSRQKITLHALYQMAELSLINGNPEAALKFIQKMDDELGRTGYRHTRRMRAVAFLQTGNLPDAAKNMAHELKNAPFSVINARFQRIILRQINAPKEVIAAADRNFAELCKMRNISPSESERFTVEKDDSPFPQTNSSRSSYSGNVELFAGMAKEIFAALILMLAVYYIGRMILKYADLPLIPALATGIIICGIAVLILPLAIVKYAVFLLAIPGAYSFICDYRKEWKTIVAAAVIFILLLPALLLPPAAWDEQVSQIALLNKYLFLTSVMPLPENPYSAYPSLGQIWLLPSVASGGMNVPLLISGMLTVIMGVIFFNHAEKLSGKIAAAAALAAVMLSPVTWTLTRSFYAELSITLFALTGAWLLLKDDLPRQKSIFFAGVMAGAALAVKLTGGCITPALFILLICRKESRKYFLLFICGAFLTALPFFLRVWIACGNPFYPYFSNLFHASAGACMVEEFHRALGGNYGIDPVAGIFFNWILCAYDGINYDGLAIGFQLPVIVIILIAGIIFCRFKDHRLTAIFAALAGAWIFWNLTAQQSRFLYPLLWCGAFAAIYAISKFKSRRQTILYLVLLLSVIPATVTHFPELKHFYLAWKNFIDARRNPVHFTAWQNDEVPYADIVEKVRTLSGKKIASLWERRVLYLPENVTVIMPRFQEKLTPVPGSSMELYAILKEYDYLIIRPPRTDVDKGIEFIPEAVKINDMLISLLKTGKLTIFHTTSDGQISILRIVPETAPISTLSSN